MAEVTLRNEKTEVLVVNIGKEKYNVPLGGSLPFAKLKKLKTDEDTINFFKEYIPEEIVDALTLSELKTLAQAWSDATKESQGLTPGES